MNATVSDLMVSPVVTVTKHERIGHARRLMHDRHVSALPVVGPEGEPIGIVTASDLVGEHRDGSPVSSVMTDAVYTVPPTAGPHVAARVMRNHHLHHIVVVDHHMVIGMLSTFDLLRVVEDHRFVAKAAPTPARRPSSRV